MLFRSAWRFAQLERFGFPILLVLLFTGLLSDLLTPVIEGVLEVVGFLFQLPF